MLMASREVFADQCPVLPCWKLLFYKHLTEFNPQHIFRKGFSLELIFSIVSWPNPDALTHAKQ